MKVIALSPSTKDVHIISGTKLTYSYQEHLSMGYTADFEIEDIGVLQHIGSETNFEQKQLNRNDAATTTFIFEAISQGTTLLLIHNYFRSELEKEYQFRVTVY